MNFESVVELAHAEGRDLLNEVEAKQLLAQAGVPVVETVLASSVEEAKLAAEKIGYPVVVKVVSADISHKSDVGGVKIGLADAEEVSQAYQAIMENSREAVLISPLRVPPGKIIQKRKTVDRVIENYRVT